MQTRIYFAKCTMSCSKSTIVGMHESDKQIKPMNLQAFSDRRYLKYRPQCVYRKGGCDQRRECVWLLRLNISKTSVPHLQVEGTTMLENMNANRFEETNNKVSRVWAETVNEWQNERFVVIYEKRICKQRSGRCDCFENGKQFCDLTCDQCAYRYEASSNLLNGLKFHIGDLVVKLAKRLLVSFVAQSLIDLIESLVE